MRKTIAIASGKGGTGKTSVSVNIASLLSANKPKEFDAILLCDLDVEEPNSMLFFQHAETLKTQEEYRLVPKWDESKCSFCGKCSQVCEFNSVAFLGNTVMIFSDLCHSCHACSVLCPEDALPMQNKRMGESSWHQAETLALCEYRLDIGQPSAVPLISSAINYLESNKEDNQLVILDAPPGTSCPMIEVCKDVDYVVLVTEPTPFGLHDLSLAVDTVRTLNREFGVVINKSGSGDDNLILEYCKTENINILGQIPQSREIAEAYSRGKLVYDLNTDIRLAWDKLNENLIKEIA